MDKIDDEIKKKIKQDQFISKKAEDIFENFLKGGDFMENNDIKVNPTKEEKMIKKSMKIRKLIAAGACIMTLLGGGQIYASTQGYGNVFFLIKYVITGQKTEIKGKDNILSDRDITISYESIVLTEKIKMQVRNLQIKDNKAKLFIAVEENPVETDTTIVPFLYKVYNSKNELICEQKSVKNGDSDLYLEELTLNKFSENENIIKLEIFKANNEKLTTLNIDLNTREVSVEGEKEAVQKISEIELKEFLKYVAVYEPLIKNATNEDYKILFAEEMFFDKIKGGSLSLTEINNMIESLGYEKISENYKGTMYKVNKSKNNYEIETITRANINPASIVNIKDISYCSDLYTVKFNYLILENQNTFEVDYSKVNPIEATLHFKLNNDKKYSTFKVVKFENETEESSVDEAKKDINYDKVAGKWSVYYARLNDKEVSLSEIYGSSVKNGIGSLTFYENGNFQYIKPGVSSSEIEDSGTFTLNGTIITLKYTNRTEEITYYNEEGIIIVKEGNYEILYCREDKKIESDDGSDSHSNSMSSMPLEDAYYNIEEIIIKETDTYKEKTQYDMDKDGVNELIIMHGTSEADMEINFYTYKDGKAVNLGTLSGSHSVLYIMNNEKGLLKVVAHMGYENVRKISIQNNKIVETEISSRYVPENEEYTEGDIELFSNTATNNKISNLANSVSWKQHIATGMKIQYPENFNVTSYTNEYNPSTIKYYDKSVEFEGDVLGINDETGEKINSHMKITVYQPYWEKFINANQVYYADRTLSGLLNFNNFHIANEIERTQYTSKIEGIDFLCSKLHKDNKEYDSMTYWNQDTNGGFGYRILIELQNENNPKVRNIIEYIMTNIDLTSF